MIGKKITDNNKGGKSKLEEREIMFEINVVDLKLPTRNSCLERLTA
ncbi:MAG: hypothetical protein KAV18_03215 [Candidatus Omnitrophica bacterium]|nr:hypothetical protein [Candidatus Omnitrophota bacterium]